MKTKLDLSRLTDQDLTSLLLFSLYKMQNDPKYSTLSSLAFLLDNETLVKLLSLYGGLDIKIPTLTEFQTLINALSIYNNVNLEHKDLAKVVTSTLARNPHLNRKDVLDTYASLCNILQDYSIDDEVKS